MPSSKVTVALLVSSLLVNTLLAVLVAVDATNTHVVVETALVEMAEQSFRLQREVLADLESGDAVRIEALKARLRASATLQGAKSYAMRTSPRHSHSDSR